MNIRESVYMMSLVGALGGLISWAAVPLILFVSGLRTVEQERYWVAELIDLLMVGLFISALYVCFADYWDKRRVGLRRLVEGALGGCLSGFLGGAILYAIRVKWVGGQNPMQASILAWAITGASIGLALGLIRYGLLLRRVLLSLLGGAVGAAAGGVISLSLGELLPYLTHALGLMITGCGVAFGSTAAVVIMRTAQIKFIHSDDPEVANYFVGRKREWDLQRGDRYLLGRDHNAPDGRQYLCIPDQEMAKLHAEIYEANGKFYLSPHDENRGPSGSIFTLSLRRLEKQMDVDKVEQLEDGDEILLGYTRFLFSLQGRNGVRSLAISTIAWIALLLFQQNAYAQSSDQFSDARFKLVDKVRLYQCEPGSERPCFRVKLNIVDRNGDVLPIPVLGPQQAIQQTQMFEGGSQLQVAHVGLGFGGGKPQRFAILLVDVSGSMLDSMAPGISGSQAMRRGLTKFHAMKRACSRFAKDFADGVDQMAVIPFASRKVVAGVNGAVFCASKECLETQINNLRLPSRDARTGLYSAVQAAIERLRDVRTKAIGEGYPDPQCLLVVMTDGMNNVGHPGDDAGLLRDFPPVQSLAERIEIPIVTVGFGDVGRIDTEALAGLAWPQAAKNYFPARNADELIRAFQKARTLQLQQLQITFLPLQTLRGQLVKQHDFTVRFKPDSQSTIQGVYQWLSSGLGAPPFEGLLPPEERPLRSTNKDLFGQWFITYFGTLILLGALLYLLWFKAPPLIWADEHDLPVLLRRALSVKGRRGGDVR